MSHANPNPKILLHGNSILMESLASRLNQVEGCDVARGRGGDAILFDQVNFIIIDLCDANTAESLPLLTALPGVILIGVDSIANTITVLTGRTRPLNSTQIVLDALKKAM